MGTFNVALTGNVPGVKHLTNQIRSAASIRDPKIGLHVAEAIDALAQSVTQVAGTVTIPASSSGINQLTGDVTAGPGSGSQASTLAKIQGNPVAAPSPTAGQVLTWSGANWQPSTPLTPGLNQLTGDVTAGPGTGSQVSTLAKIQGNPVLASTPSSGQVLTWNGTDWVPSTPTSGITQLNSDVIAGPGSGNQSASVHAIQGNAVLAGIPNDKQILQWNNGANQWQATDPFHRLYNAVVGMPVSNVGSSALTVFSKSIPIASPFLNVSGILVRVRGSGRITVSGGNSTFNIQLFIGGSQIFTYSTASLTTGFTYPWNVNCDLIIVSAGSSGSAIPGISFFGNPGSATEGYPNPALASFTLNTTISETIFIYSQVQNTTSTVFLDTFTVEVIQPNGGAV